MVFFEKKKMFLAERSGRDAEDFTAKDSGERKGVGRSETSYTHAHCESDVFCHLFFQHKLCSLLINSFQSIIALVIKPFFCFFGCRKKYSL